MAAAKDTPDVTAFVNSFSRRSLQYAESIASAEASSPPEHEPSMQALPATEALSDAPPVTPRLVAERLEEPAQKGRKESATTASTGQINYAETFLAPIQDRKTKAVYITEDAHRTISAIAQASDNTHLADVLGNIINHHFETYGPDIRAFMAEQEKKNKRRLLF